jgi:hypothetical protein
MILTLGKAVGSEAGRSPASLAFGVSDPSLTR